MRSLWMLFLRFALSWTEVGQDTVKLDRGIEATLLQLDRSKNHRAVTIV
jgi:hypothetical protein